MVKAKKMICLFIAIGLVVCLMSVNASAASTNTAGLEDGFYFAQTEPKGPEGQQIFAKLSVSFTNKKVDVDVSKFNYFLATQTGPQAYSRDFIQYVSEDQKPALEALLDEIEYYNKQLAAVGDGAKISKYSKAASEDLYKTFQALWKVIVTQAGGKIDNTSKSVTSLSLNLKDVKVAKNSSIQLTATAVINGKSVKVTNDVVWKSSNSKVATVSKGKIKGVSKGTAKITASYKGKSVTVNVTVK